MYYVYEWFLVDTNEIIYVGKGSGRRYLVRCQRNKYFTDMLEHNLCDSRIVKYFEDEKDAYEYEYEYIREKKKNGECRCNIYEGGSGGSGEYWTDELRKEYSERNVMKDKLQRERMSNNNPMKNRDVVSKVAKKKSKPVIIGDKYFQSIKDAASEYKTYGDTISRWCKKGINKNGEQCRYADEEQILFNGVRYNKGGCKGMTYKSTHYESPIDLANEIHVSTSAIYSWLRRGYDTKGNYCRYDDDKRELHYENPFKGKPPKPIIVNGVRYNSREEASEKLGIGRSALYSYLQGRRSNPKYICTYDNQQPSQGNTDNSTLEGSTTNE